MCKSINIELSGGKMNYFDTFDWSTFSLRKKGINQADQNNSFHQNTNFLFKTEAYKRIFLKAVFALYLS